MSDWRSVLAEHAPAFLAHEGVWRGVYQHIDVRTGEITAHDAQVVCEFPGGGPHAYIQHNTFTWADGRVEIADLPGVWRHGRIWWDLPTFSGSAWDAGDGVVLLNLVRKDEPGVVFFEMIVPPTQTGARARTWHWLKDGELVRRTLCNERRTAP
ncbi:MAG: hypothetical protein AAGB25_05285 [Pseudomonadota bacterium]